ncbi:uncharacterized protein [Nicotiana tomentosiformis]|uniref:uncharacterized protein n=1 Tax=Nicotiana tomentosiformis TaxID=4098 RepID=UPI00388C9738
MAILDENERSNDLEADLPTGNGQSSVDLSSPLYMHPSDNPGAMLVSVPFNGVGYRSWRRSVLRALSMKNKVGFINGECKKPDPDSQKLRLWERCDDMVTSWILNSLSKEIADSVEYKEINDLSQGSLDITGYYTKMKKLWEELSNLSAKNQCTCHCTCGAKETFSLLVQEEKQREVKPNNQFALESTSLNVNTFKQNSYRTNYSPSNNYNGTNKSRPMCEYCKRPGHTKD